MNQIRRLNPFQAFVKFWETLNTAQRFVTALFISLSIMLLCVISVVATRPQMAILFSGLEPEDAGAIIAKLQENKIPYEVDGSAIKVPKKHVHEMRMQLASQGLPQGGTVGFEIFDKTSFGMTEFAQRLNYQRALQGELSRTINQINGVLASRVHIAMPSETIFKDEEKVATASVVVKLRPGASLTSEQVAGIVHLVSAAVEGLKPNRVTVVDTNGNLLSESGDESTGLDPRLSSAQLRMKREHERQLEKDIQAMLERVVGPNRAIVRVNTRINFDRTETNSEVYNPVGNTGKGVVLSEETLSETYGGLSNAVGGVVGIAANVRQGAGGSRSAVGEGRYERREVTNKYGVSHISERTIKAPGRVEDISVAVMVDEKVDPIKIPAIRNAVATAVGIDPKQPTSSSKITVERVAFDDSAIKAEEKEMQAMASKATYVSVGKTVGAVVLLFGFLLFLKKMLSGITVSIPERVTVEEIPVPSASVAEAYTQSGATAAVRAGTSEAEPEEIARTVRKWLSES